MNDDEIVYTAAQAFLKTKFMQAIKHATACMHGSALLYLFSFRVEMDCRGLFVAIVLAFTTLSVVDAAIREIYILPHR